ncbi:MAG: sulfotransferase family protein [Anaerolineaceae bacterium]|jgi:hypothetical protein
MTLPNFLLIGAAKSGTTALYMFLAEHPEVFMSSRKELHFFSHPENSQLIHGPENFKRVDIATLEDYEAMFAGATTEKAIGEASPSYLYFPECATRIKKLLPDIKLIALLRNPVERAYSSYLHAIRDGWETENFNRALNLEKNRIDAKWDIVWHYQEAGFYANRINAYQKQFGPEQLKVWLYDDLVADPARLVREVYIYLDVDPYFQPHLNVKPNVSGVIKSELVAKLMKSIFDKPNPVRDISRKLISPNLRWWFTNNLRNLNLEKPHMDSKSRKHLQELFRQDIIELQCLINRDLSSWLSDSEEDYA